MTTRSEAQLKAMKERTKTMKEWNENNRNLRDKFLPKNMGKMENTENYKTFMDVYGVMPFQVDKEQAELEKSEKDLERIRARSAVINTVSANEIQRRKMNEVRLLQAKMKREEEKRRLKQNMKPRVLSQ